MHLTTYPSSYFFKKRNSSEIQIALETNSKMKKKMTRKKWMALP